MYRYKQKYIHAPCFIGVVSVCLQWVVVCCSLVQCGAVSCSVISFMHPASVDLSAFCCVCCSVLQRVAVCCSVVWCHAVSCSVLQCGAVWCSVVQCGAV